MNRLLRNPFPTVITLAAFVLSLAVPALADERVNTSSGLTLAGAPLAIHGYDPVAYFSEGRAVRGRSEHIVAHGGAAYQFANAENKARFEKEPQRYLPQYGGFCAYGVALGAKFDGDPEVFRLVDGKLYLPQSRHPEEMGGGSDGEPTEGGPELGEGPRCGAGQTETLNETDGRGVGEEDLTERQRTALLAMLRGMPQDEIARRTGSNRNAVYKLIHDARRRLKERLEAAGYSPADVGSAFNH